ncbi:Sec23/Sec24 trunk domain protein [Necator americanus]|uniref:Sec23/Sec24 trunk domain protein n=1 Tax=Necator americanus TaxID=51031 RepID=W2SW94_NECAM|nr:Sec23/Sec24 trunk domain protein [Necator americanus]ETN73106.1 Sec23/Sec24 trunk domain protein [Necator americanus]
MDNPSAFYAAQSPALSAMPPSINQVQQGFSQMNMSGGRVMPTQPTWGGAYPNDSRAAAAPGYSSDLVDLMAERNILQLGFDDIEYTLPHNMANNAARVDPSVFRCTLTMVPQTEELLKKSRLPLGLTLHPFRDMKNLNIIQTSTIVRCRYCRTYINPYVYLPDSRHWKCNLCNRNNDLPDDFCWDPNTKSFGDPVNRPEIKHPTVEFIAPNEYMLRPPQPAVYVFVLDVSAAAVESGYLFAFSEQLLINLDQLPGDERTQIAFVAVDSMVHFYQFSSGSRSLPKELVVDEVDDMFLPTHHGILVPLKKNIDAVRSFVEKLPVLFERTNSSSNCLGCALKIVHELIAEIGGRITVLQATLPNTGPASLKPREDPNQRADNDVQNLVPATDFYKTLALECTGHQIALDLFLLNTQYADLSTLSEIAKFSTGCVYHFPNYHCLNDIIQTSFCAGRSIKLDDRVAAMLVLRFCPLEQILSEFYPQMYRINEILQMEEGKWPAALPLSFEYISRDGLYLIEAGSALYLYVSSNCGVQLVQDLFGCAYEQIDEHSFRCYDNPFSEKVHAFVRHVTALKFYVGPVIIVKEESPIREVVVRRLVDDRSESTHSYVEFLQHIKREINN